MRGSALGPAVTVTPTAATASAARFKGITTAAAAITAVFPATGTGAALTATGIAPPVVVATAAAVTTTTAAAIAASPIATTTSTGGTATGLGLVDPQGAAHQLRALQAIDGPVFHLGIGHLHEGESALAAGIPLQREGAVHDFAKGGKQLCHVLLLSTEGQIANKNTHEPGRPQGRSMRAPGPLTGQA